MTLNKMFEQYIEHLKLYNSGEYVSYNLDQQKAIVKYFGDIESSELTIGKIKEFMLYLKSKDLSANTINKYVSTIKRIYTFHEVPTNFYKIKKLKEKFVTYGCLNKEDSDKLLKILPELSLYNQCMFLLFMETGIRSNELIHVKTENVNLNERYIWLEQTKTNKPRYVFFTYYTKKKLEQYIKSNSQVKDNYLFLSKKSNEILSRYTIKSTFTRIKEKYGFEKLSPHMLRHSLCTNLYNNGANILFVCSVMGHCNPNITKRYVHHDLHNDLKMFDKYYKK